MRTVLIAAVLGVTAAPAAAGPDVVAGGHTIASVVMGGGKQGNSVMRGGVATGIDLELGVAPGAVAVVLEQLWRFPEAYADARERSVAVEYRHHFDNRRRGFVAVGAGVRRLDTRDDGGALEMRGYDVRVQGAIAAWSTATVDLHVRFGLTYGCYTRAARDDGSEISVGCLESLLGQMLVGVDLARRW